MRKLTLIVLLLSLFGAASNSASAAERRIPNGASVFIVPSEGFETYLTAAIEKKKVPLTVLLDKAKAQYVIDCAHSTGKEPGFAQTWVLGKRQANDDASVRITETSSSAVIWAYSVHKYDARHGAQSTAEAVAKHLKETVGK